MNVSEKAGGIVFDVQVVPRSSKNAIGKVVGDRLKIYLTAPPVDGAANEALRRLVASELEVSPRNVAIIAGETGRKKTLQVKGASPAKLQQLVTETEK
jgi:uncharacterized protein (TIGR00251 family)